MNKNRIENVNEENNKKQQQQQQHSQKQSHETQEREERTKDTNDKKCAGDRQNTSKIDEASTSHSSMSSSSNSKESTLARYSHSQSLAITMTSDTSVRETTMLPDNQDYKAKSSATNETMPDGNEPAATVTTKATTSLPSTSSSLASSSSSSSSSSSLKSTVANEVASVPITTVTTARMTATKLEEVTKLDDAKLYESNVSADCCIVGHVPSFSNTQTLSDTTTGSAFLVCEGQQLIANETEAAALSTTKSTENVNELFDDKANLSPTTNKTATTANISEATTIAIAEKSPSKGFSHVVSEPTFGIQMRMQQKQKIKSYHDAKQTTVWRTDSLASNSSTTDSNTTKSVDNTKNDDREIQACSIFTASPCLRRKSSDIGVLMPRRVSFPKNDKELVTGYLEPANPWEQACRVKSISEITELYVASCLKHKTAPLQPVLDHLRTVDLCNQIRQPSLSLKSIVLTPNVCEPLEEVFKRVQYKSIDISQCSLDDSSVNALCQMIEYYEAANELDISSNGLTHSGWTSCTYMVGRSQELQVLNAEGNPISKLSADNLGSALKTSNMHTLKLEHCGLKGLPLFSLCNSLYSNKTLKELWLGYNDLDCSDAANLSNLLCVNHCIELIDISNNNIMDEGMVHLVKALLKQAVDLERHSKLQRTTGRTIEDDESLLPVASSPIQEYNSSFTDRFLNYNEQDGGVHSSVDAISASGDASVKKDITENSSVTACSDKLKVQLEESDNKTHLIETVTAATKDSEIDADVDTENSVRSSGTVRSFSQNATGQSMLDKLLSMNSDSSSSTEDGPSIISTDTLAACCSEDISAEMSDEIFDVPPPTPNTTVVAPLVTNVNTTIIHAILEEPLTATTTTFSLAQSSKYPTSADMSDVSATSTNSIETTPSVTSNIPQDRQEMLQQQSETILCDITTSPESTSATVRRDVKSCTDVTPLSSSATSPHGSSSSSSTSTNGNDNGTNSSSSSGISNCDVQKNSQIPESFHCAAGETEKILQSSDVFVETAIESCVNGAASGGSSRPLDVTKTLKAAEDYEDTHSTDSAFESASEGDISRHLPDEFSRLSTSLESTRLDDIAKDMIIETATIASESTEYLIAEEAGSTLASTPTPALELLQATKAVTNSTTTVMLQAQQHNANVLLSATAASAVQTITDAEDNTSDNTLPKVTISPECLTMTKEIDTTSHRLNPAPTPPPPFTSPGGAVSMGMRRTESTVAFLNQSTRIHSQSSESLCSENSLDNSSAVADPNFTEKLTKNDTLSRRNLIGNYADPTRKSLSGLKALTVWSNNLTKESASCIADLLSKTTSLELLNIGKNCLSNEFVAVIKDSLIKNSTLTTLGLQSAHLSAKGIEILASILTFGGNNKLQRIDIRDNKLEVESLNIIAEVLKSNKTITQIDINDEPKRLTIGSDAHLDYARILQNVRSMCSRNEKIQTQLQTERSNIGGSGSNRCRGGYYLGSRKISLTCHSRPLVDMTTGTVSGTVAVTTTPTPVAKLETKRKTGVRLRSPGPSPPTISPSSSPSRSRFQVSRVHEVSPLTSPLAQTPPPHPPKSSSSSTSSSYSSGVSIPTASVSSSSLDYSGNPSTGSSLTSLPMINSLPAMATATSSTQTIKRLSVSPRSRFHVCRIYEDTPTTPLGNTKITPITPPLNPPPTPMLKSSRRAAAAAASAQLASTINTPLSSSSPPPSSTMMPTTTIVIVEPNKLTNDEDEVDNGKNPTPLPHNMQFQDSINHHSLSSTAKNSTLSSSSCSIPTSVSSSSSSSTSPLTPTSYSSESSSSSSSTSSASATLSSTDATGAFDEVSNVAIAPLIVDTPALRTCPIVVFGDNDITLTKESAAGFGAPVAPALDEEQAGATNNNSNNANSVGKQQQQQQRARKMSWIANQTAVDKLLNLFNPSTIFQRSSSPESKAASTQQNGTQSTTTNSSSHTNTVAPARKTSHSSWPKLNAECLSTGNAVTSSNDNIASDNSASAIMAATATFEQSRSFLDTASRQLLDLRNQIFRPNPTFGNDCANTMAAVSGAAIDGGALTSANADATHIPTDIKIEVKENISPEHTINDETLQALIKLSQVEDLPTSGKEPIELCNRVEVTPDKDTHKAQHEGDN